MAAGAVVSAKPFLGPAGGSRPSGWKTNPSRPGGAPERVSPGWSGSLPDSASIYKIVIQDWKNKGFLKYYFDFNTFFYFYDNFKSFTCQLITTFFNLRLNNFSMI
jgi:hypothetical protein